MKTVQKIIIDGYNLIYADGELRKIIASDLEQAREKLVGLLKRYLQRKTIQITLVFDGKGGMLDSVSVLPGKFQVVFSRAHQSADELIVATLKESPNPRQFIVVTSDNADIGRMARNLGCKVIESKLFLSRLVGEERELGPPKEKPDLSEGEVEYWLRKFGSTKGNEEGKKGN